MKVHELITYLKNFNPDAELIVQADGEGNSYSPLAGADKGFYVADTTWSGTFYDHSWTADDCDMDDEEFAELQSLPLAIVLYPVN